MSLVVNFLQSYFEEIEILFSHQKYQQAYDIYLALYQQYPNNIELLNSFGKFLIKVERHEESLHLFKISLEIDPSQANTYCDAGVALCHLKRFQEAVHYYEKALSLNQDIAEAYSNLGATYYHLEDFEQAYKCCLKAVRIDPLNPQYLSNLSNSLNTLSRFEESLVYIDRCLEEKTDFSGAYLNRGIALYGLFRYEEAIESFERCIWLDPLNIRAMISCAASHVALLQIDIAIQYLDQALQIDPKHAEANFSKAWALLINGELEKGFKLYESRFSMYHGRDCLRNYSQNRLLDQDIKDKIVFVYTEQGLGDCIQYCRYIPMLKKLGAKVIFQVPNSLVSIMKTLSSAVDILCIDVEPEKFDYHIPAASLPYFFKTNINTIPSIPYLHPEKEKVNHFQTKIQGCKKKKIGFVFAGSRKYFKDPRSIDVTDFTPLFRLPADFYCLQKELTSLEELLLSDHENVHIHTNDLHNFSDTAALIACMDFVITVDTATAHLCG
ncbi:MAG: tetratricopeptide repeat protein, partial [Chlamydiae bacterium]|nr:tetratricopeptide repeat protein [Chlamydiota bacterium]